MISWGWKTWGGIAIAAALSACSGTDGPSQAPMLADGACGQLRNELNAMDKRGVPSMIDARNNGKKYGPQQDGEINRYNQVLDQYLGGQCASEVRYKQKAGIPLTSGKQASVPGVTTGSLSKTQVKRRKPVDDDEGITPASATSDEQLAPKPTRRKSTAAQTAGKDKPDSKPAAETAAAPAAAAAPPATPIKAESGLPAAPAPIKSEAGDKKE